MEPDVLVFTYQRATSNPVKITAMQISFEGRIGIILGLLGLVGVGFPMIAPSQANVGWAFIGVALLGFIGLAAHHALGIGLADRKPGHARRMIAVYGMLASAIIFFGFGIAYFWPSSQRVSATSNLPKEVSPPSPVPIVAPVRQTASAVDPQNPSEVGKVFSNRPLSYFLGVLETENNLQANSLLKAFVGDHGNFQRQYPGWQYKRGIRHRAYSGWVAL